ncbi:glycosyltransferase [Halopseudomonas salegens]|uniref:glycosyltransferase n=1 Tax=Halopseudomonas salegens TaxID=1434072 RepID=UPI0038B32E28
MPSNSATPKKWSREEKCRIVLETAPMTEAERSEYCRKHGLYPEQVEAWKTACMVANAHSHEQARRHRKAASRARYKERFTWERVLGEYEQLLTKWYPSK